MLDNLRHSESPRSNIDVQHVTHPDNPTLQASLLVRSSVSSSSLQANNDHESPGLPATLSLTAVARRPSILDDEDQPTAAVAAAAAHTALPSKVKEEPVTWMSLPKKGQLAVLTLARLSEPLSERSLGAYLFYQLRSFDPSLPDSTITYQGGLFTAAFAAAQFLTAVWWGRAADTPWIGRKRVLLVGLLGTAVASIGVGFSRSFYQALFFRALAGALNGNIGVMRTMISEMIQEKKFQSRAFMLLPMCFNIGVVIGPIMGGFLADPVASFPNVFGPGSVLGGKNGVGWMITFPYAFPNLFSGIFIIISALAIIFGLDETHPALRDKLDRGRQVGQWLARMVCHRVIESDYAYTRLQTTEDDVELQDATAPAAPKPDLESAPKPLDTTMSQAQSPAPTKVRSPFYTIFHTKNILLTLLSHHLLAFHLTCFNAIVFLFLPSPRSPDPPSHFTLRFTGGLGLSPSKVGLAAAVIGLIGFPLQILLYPPVTAKLGTLRSYRMFLPFSAVAYTLMPFISIFPDRAWLVWLALVLVLASQVLSRTFVLTSTVILINNSSPGPEALGTLHGVAQSVSSAARMLGPTVGGWALGLGLRNDCVGAVWWAIAGLVMVNWGILWMIYEGDGKGGRA